MNVSHLFRWLFYRSHSNTCWRLLLVCLYCSFVFFQKTFPDRVLLASVVTAFFRSLAKFGRHVPFSKFSPFDWYCLPLFLFLYVCFFFVTTVSFSQYFRKNSVWSFPVPSIAPRIDFISSLDIRDLIWRRHFIFFNSVLCRFCKIGPQHCSSSEKKIRVFFVSAVFSFLLVSSWFQRIRKTKSFS